MPAIIIRYKKVISLALANNAINFTESSIVGHRVQIPMSVDYLNTFFVWERTSGSPRPIGHFVSEVGSVKFMDVLISSLNKLYTDIDGSVNGLNFSSFILDSNYDSRVRCDGISANDIVMAYILYKCYGASSAPTMNVIYNLEDAHKMITSSQLASAIVESLEEEEQLARTAPVDKGDVDAMFRYMLSANPLRYFKADGKQINGLFETNFCCGEADPPGTGPWGFIENDIVELRINFTFPQDVTHTTADDLGGNRTVVIPAGSNFGIRLQILAIDTPAGASSKQAAAAAAAAAAASQQQVAAAASITNATIAAAMAEGQRQAAAYRTSIEDTAYTKAVNDNASQAIRASNTQAIANAAFLALQEAIVSGSTQTSIQNLRSAAVAAAAAAARANTIALQAATILQNAENSRAAARQALEDAETAAASAAYASATAASITVEAAKAKAQADAATIAASKEAATQATDPEIKILTDAENKLLDPQTLTGLRLTLNSTHSKTVSAWSLYTSSNDYQNIISTNLASVTSDLNSAISSGKSEGEINILQQRMSSLTDSKKASLYSLSKSITDFIIAQANEKIALDNYTATATQAADLAKNVAQSALTYATGVLNKANTDYTAAIAANTQAQTTLTSAQTALTAAITGGAIMSEVTTLRQAVINASAAAKITSIAAQAATSAKSNADYDVTSLTDALNSAVTRITTTSNENASLIQSYNDSLETYV